MHFANQKIKEFDQRHGGESYAEGAGGFRYYADGALREVNPLGALIEPPQPNTHEGEWMLYSNKLMFAKLKLQAVVNEFEEENERLCHWIPPNPDAALANLQRLQSVIDERKQAVAAAEERLKQTHWGRCKTAMQQREQESRQRFLEFQKERRAIRV